MCRPAALITNKDVIAVNQTARDNHPVENLPARLREGTRLGSFGDGAGAVAPIPCLFNLDDEPVSVEAPWDKLGLDAGQVARGTHGPARGPMGQPCATCGMAIGWRYQTGWPSRCRRMDAFFTRSVAS